MSEHRKYTTEDLNIVIRIILTIAIFLGGYTSITHAINSFSTMGTPYACAELLCAVITIISYVLMIRVNIMGVYIYSAMWIISIIATFCVDIESGFTLFFSALGSLGLLSLLFILRRNGTSGWRMMVSNQKLKKSSTKIEETLPTVSMPNKSECLDASLVETSCSVPPIVPTSTVAEEIPIVEISDLQIPPPINQITNDILDDPKIKQNPGRSVKSERRKLSLSFSFNVFVYIAFTIFILIQILSICMDAAFMQKYWWTATLIGCRIALTSINIGLILIILFWQKGWTYICLSIISVALIFVSDSIDPMAVKYKIAERDFAINIAIFSSSYIPLLITLFLKKDGRSGWQILFPKIFTKMESAKQVRTNEPDIQVPKEELDRYTKLYRAISPANFVEPYSPEKVKLANELLEALIQNKDNEVVISLIEEKAKAKLGVKLSDN